MCGIYCCFCTIRSSVARQKLDESTRNLLKRRGPDAYTETRVEEGLPEDWSGLLASSILWTQGPRLCPGPLTAPDGSFLLWNGDKYSEEDSNFGQSQNDSEEVFSHLLTHGVQYLTTIVGPYAFVYYSAGEGALWLGRDGLGRRSLLWSPAQQESLVISSVGLSEAGAAGPTLEVPHYAIYQVNFSSASYSLKVHPWYHLEGEACSPAASCLPPPLSFRLTDPLVHRLFNFVLGEEWLEAPAPDAPRSQQRSHILTELGVDPGGSADSIFPAALATPSFSTLVAELKTLLTESVRRRIRTQPPLCQNCLGKSSSCSHPKTGILFSGGLDSAILAVIATQIVPQSEPIDLLNVCFLRSGSPQTAAGVPDRRSGLSTLQELRALFPHRVWNFVEINVSMEELEIERKRHIRQLIRPLGSVLDDSLGCALWFAARGLGSLDGLLYRSPARVVLVGMGADELFGGYSRHRKVFATQGWPGLARELQISLIQIGTRNLGRDDRVVSDHGRVVRTPYLDEAFLAYCVKLPPWRRCQLEGALGRPGVGDKLPLRLLAWALGLRSAAGLPKKALQFGSHIANPREKGHLNSTRLTTS